MRTLIAVAFLAVCWLPSIGKAQVAAYIEAGGARVRYSDTVEISSGTVSGGITALNPYAIFSALAAGSATQGSSWTMFGAANGSLFTPAFRALRGEAFGSGSGTTYGSNTGSGQVLGGARLHLAGARFGTWVGLGAGSVIDPVGTRGIRQGEAGLWAQLGAAVAQVVVLPVRIAGGIDYTDTEGSIRFGNARLELGAVGGMRSNVAASPDATNTWASANATAWLLRSVGITAALGSYPADLGQGLPGASYVSLGVRIAPRRIIPAVAPLPSDLARIAESSTAAAVTVSAGANGNRAITVRVPSARTVEIMGTFTDWTPVSLSPSGPGIWSASLPISSGTQQLNIRINGGPWIVPRGLVAISDEFGGSVGILVVP